MTASRTLFSLVSILAALSLACVLAPWTAGAGSGEDFPLRAVYPEVPYITTQELIDQYDDAVIMDIRSKFEYDVAHINTAHLLPMTREDFAEALAEIRPKDGKAPMAFYCNGHTCAKSYKAAQLALSLGFENIWVYDGGIFDWIEAAPQLATVMGKPQAAPDSVISYGLFVEHLLPFERFKEEGIRRDAVFIDIRDPFQRELTPDLPMVMNIPLDSLLELITSHVWAEKPLYFFDAVGKQVRWLQYYLESNGYYDYAFLDGGVLKIADDPSLVTTVQEDLGTIQIFQELLDQASMDKSLRGADLRLLSNILAHVQFNNYAALKQAQLMDAFGLGKNDLYASLERLARGGYLAFRTHEGTVILQVNPRLAWKGETESELWEQEANSFEEGQ